MSDETTTKVDQAAYNVRIPKKVYKVRVKEVTRVKTKEKQLPMDSFVLEIIDHAEKISGVDINGLELKSQSVLTLKALTFVNQARSCFGLPDVTTQDEIDMIDGKDFIGQEGYVIAAGTAEEQKNDLTGEVLVNPHDGSKLVNYRREVIEFIPRPKKS